MEFWKWVYFIVGDRTFFPLRSEKDHKLIFIYFNLKLSEKLLVFIYSWILNNNCIFNKTNNCSKLVNNARHKTRLCRIFSRNVANEHSIDSKMIRNSKHRKKSCKHFRSRACSILSFVNLFKTFTSNIFLNILSNECLMSLISIRSLFGKYLHVCWYVFIIL